MPVVPFTSRPQAQASAPLPLPDPIYLAMAAAEMRKGAKFKNAVKDFPTSTNIDDRRGPVAQYDTATPFTTSETTPASGIDSTRESVTPTKRVWIEKDDELRYSPAKDIGSTPKAKR